jgi:hypothetical protein
MEATAEQWVSIDAVSDEIRDEPWSLYWREWKSGTEDFERFLHEPLAVLGESFDAVADDWIVTTQVVNHQHGLNYTAVCTLAIVMPTNRSVLVTLYKHGPDE